MELGSINPRRGKAAKKAREESAQVVCPNRLLQTHTLGNTHKILQAMSNHGV
jgi:hypothetical protein